MILLTRLNRASFVLSSDLIEHIEAAPDTVVSLVNGQKLLVLETPEEIVDRVIQFRRAVVEQPFPISHKAPSEGPIRFLPLSVPAISSVDKRQRRDRDG